MNQLVVCSPPNAEVVAKAQAYFKVKARVVKTKHFTIAFFPNKRGLHPKRLGKTFVCGSLLNPDEADQLIDGKKYLDLDGIFVLCKTGTDAAKLITDRFGFHPLYCYEKNDKKIYSTSLDFLGVAIKEKTINWNAWADLFEYSMCMENTTQFTEIRRIDRARVIEISQEIQETSYDDYLQAPTIRMSLKDRISEFDIALQSTYKRIRKLTTRIAVPLSGGTDSRLFAATLAKYQKTPCYSTSKDCGKFSNDNEIHLAKQVCDAIHGEFNPIYLKDHPHFFRKHFHDFLIKTAFQTTLHTWYGMLLDAIPNKYDAILDGIGDTAFKGDYISQRMIRLSKKGRWQTLRKAIERLYRILLMDRLTNGEELQYFAPPLQKMMRARQKIAFAQEFESYPKNINMPLNILVNLRFRRLIGPSMYEIMGEKFAVFSPYLSRDVGRCIFSATIEDKQELQLIQAYYDAKLPGVAHLPTNTSTGRERAIEMAIFDLVGIFPNLMKKIVLRMKPQYVKDAIQYSEDTERFLTEILKNSLGTPYTTDIALLLKSMKTRPRSLRIDVLMKLVLFDRWYQRYFQGDRTVIQS